MWHLAAESLGRFPEAIITALSSDGYPISIRQRAPRYDGRTGEMPVLIPERVAVLPGPANVLCHYHNENLWDLQMLQINGRLERRDDSWIFVSTEFTPRPRGRLKSLWQMARAMRRSSRRYLATRGLARPQVNWTALKHLRPLSQRNGPAREPRIA
jgi:hypothetical protein